MAIGLTENYQTNNGQTDTKVPPTGLHCTFALMLHTNHSLLPNFRLSMAVSAYLWKRLRTQARKLERMTIKRSHRRDRMEVVSVFILLWKRYNIYGQRCEIIFLNEKTYNKTLILSSTDGLLMQANSSFERERRKAKRELKVHKHEIFLNFFFT